MGYVATCELHAGLTIACALRLVAAGGHLWWDGARLWFEAGDFEREVPPCWRRQRLIEDTQASLDWPGGRRLHQLLKTRWHWPRMLLECIAVYAAMLPFALEHAKFNHPTYLFPTS